MQEEPTVDNMVKERNVKLEGTPFWRRETDEGYIITMGNHRITEPTKTAKQAEDLIYKLNWLTLIRVIATAVDNVLEERAKQAVDKIKEIEQQKKGVKETEIN